MTRIVLDAATLAKFQAAMGEVALCDETGKALAWCRLIPFPTQEPVLSAEERKRRREEPGAMTTAELVEHLKQLGPV